MVHLLVSGTRGERGPTRHLRTRGRPRQDRRRVQNPGRRAGSCQDALVSAPDDENGPDTNADKKQPAGPTLGASGSPTGTPPERITTRDFAGSRECRKPGSENSCGDRGSCGTDFGPAAGVPGCAKTVGLHRSWHVDCAHGFWHRKWDASAQPSWACDKRSVLRTGRHGPDGRFRPCCFRALEFRVAPDGCPRVRPRVRSADLGTFSSIVTQAWASRLTPRRSTRRRGRLRRTRVRPG